MSKIKMTVKQEMKLQDTLSGLNNGVQDAQDILNPALTGHGYNALRVLPCKHYRAIARTYVQIVTDLMVLKGAIQAAENWYSEQE